MTRFRRKAQLFPHIYTLDGVGPLRSVREFDDQITARYSGFTGADDYYFRASSARVVSRISIPTLVMNALDDPFIRVRPETREALAANPAIELIETQQGGHCAFLSNSVTSREEIFGNGRHWAESTLVRFLLATAGHHDGV